MRVPRLIVDRRLSNSPSPHTLPLLYLLFLFAFLTSILLST